MRKQFPSKKRTDGTGLTVPLRNGNRMTAEEITMEMLSVHELCKRTGITRKTLFHYDKIGILKPAGRVGPQKAKLYGPAEQARLLEILHLQEAGLSLREIRIMLDGDVQEKKELLDAVYSRMEEEHGRLLKQKHLVEQMRKEICE